MGSVHSFDTLSRTELHAMADRLLAPDAAAVEECVAFIEAHTLLVWHGRARAMMSRRLKHCRLTAGQSDRLLRVILVRLISGKFAEQFKDQLRLALHLDPAKVYEVARSCERAEAAHVRRYGAWLLARQKG